MTTRSRRVILVVSALCAVFALHVAYAQEATLSFSPSSGSFTVGKTFTVVVNVNSGGDPGINAVEATVNFDTSMLSVVDAHRDDSIFNLWTSEPDFSNSRGTITFGGGNPSAYKGSKGNIVTIVFRSLKEGSTEVSFSDASVLAADGRGTDVLSAATPATYTFAKAAVPTPVPTPVRTPTPSYSGPPPPAPIVNSPTHPEPDTWYSEKSPRFTWSLPQSVTALRLLIDHEPDSAPTVPYNRRIAERQLDDLDDGTWYFHIQFYNPAGWGPITHRKVMIDTGPPFEFTPRIEVDGATATLIVDVVDDVSGVDRYEVIIDGNEPIEVDASDVGEEGRIELPQKDVGEHEVTVRAYDQVGNMREAKTSYVLDLPETTPTPTPSPASENGGEEDGDENGFFGFLSAGWTFYLLLLAGLLLIALLVLLVLMYINRKKQKQEIERITQEAAEARTKVDNVFEALREEIDEQIEKIGSAAADETVRKEVERSLSGALDISEEIIEKEIDDIEEPYKKVKK